MKKIFWLGLLSLAGVFCSLSGAEGPWVFPQKSGNGVYFRNLPDWGTAGFTLEVWCRPDKTDCGYAVLMRGSFGYPNFFGSRDINCYLKNTAGQDAAGRVYTPLEPGKYHYYCLTGTPEACCAWRDGKLMRTNKGNGIPKYLPGNVLHVGRSLGWGNNFEGEVALIRIHKKALTAQLSPALTTVSQPFAEVGQQAVTMLVKLISGKPAVSMKLTPQVVMRETV